MTQTQIPVLEGVSATISSWLSQFVDAAREAYGDGLVSVVLYGSGAEGKLSPTSDVNLLLVLRSFSEESADRMRATFLAAEAAIRLQVMFLLEKELPEATEFFAQKFADILRRHRVLFGSDPFASVKIARDAQVFRLKQILLNLALRLRQTYVARGEQTERIPRILADAVGPLRAASATLLQLEGQSRPDATKALETIAASAGPASDGIVPTLLAARNGQAIGPEAQKALFQTIELITRMSERAAKLS